MNQTQAMKIATSYAKLHHADCDILWYAGEQSGWHFVWMKNSSLPRYTGMGSAIKISPKGNVIKVTDGTELRQISQSAIKLNA